MMSVKLRAKLGGISLLLLTSACLGGTIAPLGKQLNLRYQTLRDDETEIVIIYFADKGDVQRFAGSNAQQFISERSIKRRMKMHGGKIVVDASDYPLEQSYVRSVERNVAKVRHQLKWFDAVSAIATRRQIETIREFPFVKEINLVGRWRSDRSSERIIPTRKAPMLKQPAGTFTLDYGPSFTQLNQINVPAVHNLGFCGQGVVICVFDEGVDLPAHEAFGSMNIIAQHDFVDHKTSVVPYDPGAGGHGEATLSAIGGFKPGSLIGPAFKADYILARTENDSSETPIEEDNWAKAIEWADSIGVDVTSTSLVYMVFDPPYPAYTWQDMDGKTMLITQAADHAVGLGIVVVNAAGNFGYNSSHNTLWGPADGDSVITVGAVDASGIRADFSSVGPTVDGRFKPDVMAMGSGVYLASSGGTSSYGYGDGTSFACPLAAGVAALILSANPRLTPMQVRESMRQTANNSSSPNNLYGWGLLDALAAVNYYGVSPHVTGVAYEDVNGNGRRDVGEPRVQNLTFRLDGVAADSTSTDSHGVYLFDSLSLGQYRISESVPSGWILTSPISNVDSISLDSLTKSVGGQNFGNFRLGRIQGLVFNDVNQNGLKDNGEAGIPSWSVRLSGPTSAVVTTDSNGEFMFTNIGVGSYTVSESLQLGWVQILPSNNGSYLLTATSGMDSVLDFAVFYSHYSVQRGWNLLSLPLRVSDNRTTSIYPSAASNAFIYDRGYREVGKVENNVGFWLKFKSTDLTAIQGEVRTRDTVQLRRGWNIIGTLSVPVALGSAQPSTDSLIKACYLYDPVAHRYAAVGNRDTLYPTWGYWVKTSSAGNIILDAGSPQIRSATASSWGTTFSGLNSITIRDRTGGEQKLFFGDNAELKMRSDIGELPPKPPGEVFDVRFANSSGLWFPPSQSEPATANIELQDVQYPMEVTWEVLDKNQFYSLCERTPRGDEIQQVHLNSHGNMTIENLQVNYLCLQRSSSEAEMRGVPGSFGLEQNYPNPFNPSTVIYYQLPVSSSVLLKVYSVIGQEVATLVSGREEAGYKWVEWNVPQGGIPSGMYFYRIEATALNGPYAAFVKVRKLLLLK